MENKVNAILEGLNDEQRRAVEAMDGPVLIIAGAGSGKTRVLTSRVAYMLASGVDPSTVLALTFTKKAANEMKERISLLVGRAKARRVVMGTFHSVFVRFLREWAEFLGYPAQFTIYDTSDSTAAVKHCVKELGLDDKIYKPKEVLSRISGAKNNLVTAEAYRCRQDLLTADTRSHKPELHKVYSLYQRKLKESGVMDFDDILVNMNILLRDNPEALDSLSRRFAYILVDEYQDTNYSQYIIVKKLSQLRRNVCVVGDDSQSIYAFRGAQIQNIFNFSKDFPEAKVFRLESNYRSTSTIVDAANSVIEKNTNRIPKVCHSMGEKGDPIRIISSYNETGEAAMVADEIVSKMRKDSSQYSDFAILYRTNNQSRALEEALRRRNIPYMIYSGNSFYERAEVKDMMAYLKLAVNPLDEESFKRVVNKPARGIGDTSLDALDRAARAHQTSLFKAAWLDDLESFGLRTAAITKIKAFCGMINRFAQDAFRCNAEELAIRIADESGYRTSLATDTSIEGMARKANVEELLDSISIYVDERTTEAEENGEDVPDITLGDYLENVSLLANADTDEGDDSNRVSLMTVHSAKGLEFKHVLITGLEDNLFPSMNMVGSLSDLEEERRLFYVALTRAKKDLVLTHATSRMRNGKTENNPLSRFVKEIDSQYLEDPSAVQADYAFSGFGGFGSRSGFGYGRSGAVHFEKRPAAAPGQRPSASSAQRPAFGTQRPAAAPVQRPVDPDFKAVDMSELYEGERIEHNRFGPGRIKSITGVAPELKAVVDFDEYGQKVLLLKYAKMRPLK
ncbi:MAG: ATP-dependent helicase [Candidatus Cryptobacteroides sp.]